MKKLILSFENKKVIAVCGLNKETLTQKLLQEINLYLTQYELALKNHEKNVKSYQKEIKNLTTFQEILTRTSSYVKVWPQLPNNKILVNGTYLLANDFIKNKKVCLPIIYNIEEYITKIS